MRRARKERVGVSVLLLLLTVSAVAMAQTPTPPAAPPPPPPPPHEGTAEFSFVGTGGNTDTTAFGLSGEFIARPAPWVFTTRAAFVQNKADGELKARSFRAGFRAARTITDRLSAFAEYGYLRDTFAGIEDRNAIDGGLSYILVKPDPHTLAIEGGLGYANEKRLFGDDISTATAFVGAGYKLKLSANADLSDDARFVFSLSDSDDWRFNNILAVNAKLASILSLKASNIVRYVNAPVIGFDSTDTITSIAVVAKF
jgi:putative salt-induced outer membrane protein